MLLYDALNKVHCRPDINCTQEPVFAVVVLIHTNSNLFPGSPYVSTGTPLWDGLAARGVPVRSTSAVLHRFLLSPAFKNTACTIGLCPMECVQIPNTTSATTQEGSLTFHYRRAMHSEQGTRCEKRSHASLFIGQN
jgi:hypothetical protein